VVGDTAFEADETLAAELGQPGPGLTLGRSRATGTIRNDDAAPARSVILIIGDGMQLAHEVAASRCVTGRDLALKFHEFPYQASMTTWDVTT
jgi:alkaline phosphatase